MNKVYLTDTHCHLNLNTFDADLEEVLERAVRAGVERILVPGIDVETSVRAVELAQRYPQVFAAVGIHPNSAGDCWSQTAYSDLADLVKVPKVVAIGEIGLDYYREHTPADIQKNALEAQLDLAANRGLPVVLHNRNSETDLLQILQTWVDTSKAPNRLGVWHSFEGPLSLACQVIGMGFYLGISGPITYKNAVEKKRIIKELPKNRILIETDAPFLTPHPHRGKRNEPMFVTLIAEELARQFGLSVPEAWQITTQNATSLFLWES
jgi:TatD DNase family protein